MASEKLRIISLIVLAVFTLQACTALSQKGNVSQVNANWLYENCTSSDYQKSDKFSYSNCEQILTRGNAQAYKCSFDSGTSAGLYELTADNKLKLLCGVNTDRVVYTNGSSDTSTMGKVLIGAAVIGAAAALANSSGGGGGSSYTSSCDCPYDTAADGSRCGARSAWSRSGGASPFCSSYLLTTQDYLDKQ
jgi:hypothetical protein